MRGGSLSVAGGGATTGTGFSLFLPSFIKYSFLGGYLFHSYRNFESFPEDSTYMSFSPPDGTAVRIYAD